MVQFYGTSRPQASYVTEALGQGAEGLGRVAGEQYRYQQQRGRLQKALGELENLTPEQRRDPVKTLSSLLSATAGIPEASRMVGPLYDALLRQQQIQANKEAMEARRGKGKPPSSGTQPTVPQPPITRPGAQPGEAAIPGEIRPGGEEYFRTPEPPISPETQFPEPTAPQLQPEMSADDVNDLALDLIDRSGNTIDYDRAYQTALIQQQAIANDNIKKREEQQTRNANIEKFAEQDVNRAQSAGLLNIPGARTVAANASFRARHAKTPEDRWQYVQSQVKKLEDAYNGINRQVVPKTPLGRLIRKGLGTYQDIDQVIKNIQPDIQVYKDLGLFNELRDMLTGNLGLGAEHTETAIFPPSKEAKTQIGNFGKNKDYKEPRKGFEQYEDIFPGSKYNLDDKGYDSFKKDLTKFIQNNPKANLIWMRGYLNQDKKYSWQDISKATQELISEGIFKPDNVQQQQMQVIKQAPLPSLGQIFKYEWTGTK